MSETTKIPVRLTSKELCILAHNANRADASPGIALSLADKLFEADNRQWAGAYLPGYMYITCEDDSEIELFESSDLFELYGYEFNKSHPQDTRKGTIKSIRRNAG